MHHRCINITSLIFATSGARCVFLFPNMIEFFEIKKSKDTMKHVTGTYPWIIEKGLWFAHVAFFSGTIF